MTNFDQKRDEKWHEQALGRIGQLMDARAGTPELDRLARDVEEYEEARWPLLANNGWYWATRTVVVPPGPPRPWWAFWRPEPRWEHLQVCFWVRGANPDALRVGLRAGCLEIFPGASTSAYGILVEK